MLAEKLFQVLLDTLGTATHGFNENLPLLGVECRIEHVLRGEEFMLPRLGLQVGLGNYIVEFLINVHNTIPNPNMSMAVRQYPNDSMESKILDRIFDSSIIVQAIS